MNLENFDLENEPAAFSSLKNFLSAQSIFDDFKAAVATGLYDEASRSEMKKLLKSELRSSRTALIISETKAPPANLGFLTAPPAAFQKFEILKEGQFRAFIRSEAAKRRLKLSAPAEIFLTDFFQGDSWGVISELDKLALTGAKQPIETNQIKNFGNFALRQEAYDLARAVVSRQPLSRRILGLEKLFLQKESPHYLFNLFSSIAPASLSYRLADYDWRIKSGNLDYEEALLDFAL